MRSTIANREQTLCIYGRALTSVNLSSSESPETRCPAFLRAENPPMFRSRVRVIDSSVSVASSIRLS